MRAAKHRAIAAFQLVVSLSWALAVAWLFMVLSSISTPVLAISLIIYWASLFLGPVVLMAASLRLIFGRSTGMTAVYASLVGALILVGLSVSWVGPAFVRFLGKGDYRWAIALGCLIVLGVLAGLASCIQVVVQRRAAEGTDSP